MTNSYKWLSANCYFPIKKWHLLLNAIQNFLSVFNKDDVLFFYLEFNFTNGNNIKLSILTPEERFILIREQADSYFSTFFLNFPNDRLSQPVTGIHLPYPSAIIRFHAHTTQYNENAIRTYMLQQTTSKLIINVLKADEIDNDTIITFFAYCQIALLKVCFNNPNSVKNNLLKLNPVGQLQQQSQHKNNEDVILIYEIASDIMQQDEFEDELAWLNYWISYIKLSLKEEVNDKPGNEDATSEFFKNIKLNISKQLGISEKEERSLSGLIEQVFTNWNVLKTLPQPIN